MVTLGGSTFIRNGLTYDYCFKETIASLCGVCDEVVVLDAGSTDGTLEELQALCVRYANLRLITGGNWECAPDYRRIAMLANEAASHLKTEWHFMLQADEVLHEKSYPTIRGVINKYGYRGYVARRLNLYGDLNHYVSLSIPLERKPVSDSVIRLAYSGWPAIGDSESLYVEPSLVDHTDHVDDIVIFHYGFVRHDAQLLDKAIYLQSWFSGEGSQPDQRLLENKKRAASRFDWEVFLRREELERLPMKHPAVSRAWAEERQRLKTPIV